MIRILSKYYFRSKTTCRLVNMEQWSGEQHAYAIKSFYNYNDSSGAAQRSFCLHFKQKYRDILVLSFEIWVTNDEETGSALKKKPVEKSRSYS